MTNPSDTDPSRPLSSLFDMLKETINPFATQFKDLKAFEQKLDIKGLKKGEKFIEHRSKHGQYALMVEAGDQSPFLPNNIFVAPGSTPFPSNNTGSHLPKFIFLDCGRWLGSHRNFGLVWGRHVYLCCFDGDSGSFSEKEGVAFSNSPGRLGGDLFFDPNSSQLRDGLDLDFFRGMMRGPSCVRIMRWAVSLEGVADDYDFDSIYLIIPDIHLMTVPIASIWATKGDNKHNDSVGFRAKAEIDLFIFVNRLLKITSLNNKLKVVQIGDCYDLWVGHGITGNILNDNPLSNLQQLLGLSNTPLINDVEPLFKANKNEQVIFRTDRIDFNLKVRNSEFLKGLRNINITNLVQYLIEAVKDIQGSKPNSSFSGFDYWLDPFEKGRGYSAIFNLLTAQEKLGAREEDRSIVLNPAEAALRKLQNALGKAGMKYIYGNHDNYLIRSEISADPRLTGNDPNLGFFPRQEFFDENKSLFMEHAHRMENLIPGELSTKNSDGEPGGFFLTNLIFNASRIDKHDQTLTLRQVALKKADASAANDQIEYQKEFARFKLGRLSRRDPNFKPPNIFVIGHTHQPMLVVNSIILP